MKKIFLIIIFFSFTNLLVAQTISRYSISNASGFYVDDFYLDFTVGQIITPCVQNTQFLTSGFQQPIVNSKQDYQYNEKLANFDVNLFPNPINSLTNVIITSEFEINQVDIRVYDATGKELYVNCKHQNQINYKKIIIDFSNEKTGNYIISIIINKQIIKNISVIKN